MIRKETILGIISLFIMGMSSCEKSKKKWKLPVDVSFTFDINNTPSKSDKLVFVNGSLFLTEFEFAGTREQGEDIYFENEFEYLEVKLNGEDKLKELKYEIPQGTYTLIELEIDAEGSGDKSIIIEGVYIYSDGSEKLVRLEINSSEVYKAVATDEHGSKKIILSKDIPATATIMLDPVHWFEPVSAAMIDSAGVSLFNGDSVIVINDSMNEDIYDLIRNRVDEKTEVIFK